MLFDTQNTNLTEMTTDQIIAERNALRKYIDECTFETREDVEHYFEAVTILIWKHHLVGLIYDCYYDTMTNKRDCGDNLEGSDFVVYDTLIMQGKFPDIQNIFCEIHCTGNKEEGYRFGQVVYDLGSAKGGVSSYGAGCDGKFDPYECLEMCECIVKFAEGKWRITEEWGVRSAFGVDRVLSGQPSISR